MNQHLNSEQICEQVVGSATPVSTQHMLACASCEDEVKLLTGSLVRFRSSVRHWSDRQYSAKRFEVSPVMFLTAEPVDRAWYKGILAAIRETIHRPELPPLDLTSQPVEMPCLWGFLGGHEKTAGISSVLIHCSVIAALVVLGSMKPVQKLVKQTSMLLMPDVSAYKTAVKRQGAGGGGGGARMALEASKGALPKPSPRQFVPPTVTPPIDPKLPMPVTIVAPDDVPNIVANNLGDPLSKLGIPSNGTGIGGGIGDGLGPGVGPGNGGGVGLGSDGGFGGGVYRAGGNVSAPKLLSQVEPEYSEEARKAKWQGTVVISVIVDVQGRPQALRVVRSVGLGLDQKAMEAVAKWRFRPGMKDGKPVPVIATIEVTFRLL